MKELVISLLVLVALATAVISGSMRSLGAPTPALALPDSSNSEPPTSSEEDSSDDDSD